MAIALIPAREGSKRIVQKNTKSFCGQPLIAYSIKTALKSGLFDKVIVSTDSPYIANLAQTFGAHVPFMRPKALADDYTTTRAVIEHAISELASQGINAEYCCCIYATAPFLQVESLTRGLESLQAQPDKAFAFSVSTFDFPIQRAITRNKKGLAPMFPEYSDTRSQDLHEAIHDAGQFYWGRCKDFLSDKHLFSEHSIGIDIPRYLVQDIDTLEDWTRAELMYKAYIGR